MNDPKGGGKPAYDAAAEPPTYQKPPAEQPPYGKPPEDKPPDKPPEYKPPEKPPETKPPPGACKCEEWPIEPCPAETEPFRRLLLKLEEVLEDLAKEPTDATKKFADDLKDADKEYQGVVTVVNTYKKFYDALDCQLALAKSWKEEIDSWLVGKLTDPEKAGIKNSREKDYDANEKKICCDWISSRDKLNAMLDCLEQAKKKEEEAKENYDAVKGLEKTLTDRFGELKTLFEKAKALRDEERFKAAFAVSLEYLEVYTNLSLIRDWFYARENCGVTVSAPTSCPTSPSAKTSGDLKKDWTTDNFKAELVRRLRLLILARFQRFRWQHEFLTKTSENQKKKDACEKFRKDRREQFIQEADDIPPAKPTPTPGTGTPGGKYDKPGPPPPEQYPGGQEPQYPPPTPPTDQYQGGPKPEYPEDTPAPPTDKYRGQPKS